MSREQIDTWLSDAGVVVNWGPEFVENRTDGIDYYFSTEMQKVIGGKVIIDDPFFQKLNGYWVGRLAAVTHHFYGNLLPEQSKLDKLINNDPAGYDFESYVAYGQRLIDSGYEIPIQGLTLSGASMHAEVNSAVFVMLTKTEFVDLLKSSENMPFLLHRRYHTFDGEGPNVLDSILIISEKKIYVFGYSNATIGNVIDALGSNDLYKKYQSVRFMYKGLVKTALWNLVSHLLIESNELLGFKLTYSHPGICSGAYSTEVCTGYAEKMFTK